MLRDYFPPLRIDVFLLYSTSVLTHTCSIATLGHTTGAEVNTDVTTASVFTLLIGAANPLPALVDICGEQRKKRRLWLQI